MTPEMGWFGRVLGGATEKPGNVAGFAVVISVVMIAVLIFFVPKNTSAPVDQLYTLFGGIITLALGYLFGRHHP